MKKSIAIDMDGVIADVESHFLTWYKKEFNIKLTREDIYGKSEEDAFPEKGIIRKYASSPGFFKTVPLMDGAVEAIEKLNKKFNIYIVSAAMEFPQSLTEKKQWLEEHFPFVSWKNIIFCGDKSIINTDYMIDDHVKNLDYFKGETIMFHAFHNIHHNHHVRVNNWKEIIDLLIKEEI